MNRAIRKRQDKRGSTNTALGLGLGLGLRLGLGLEREKRDRQRDTHGQRASSRQAGGEINT